MCRSTLPKGRNDHRCVKAHCELCVDASEHISIADRGGKWKRRGGKWSWQMDEGRMVKIGNR